MFSVSVTIVAALVIKGSGYVHCFPGVPFQLAKQHQHITQTSLYQGQPGNVNNIYSQSVPDKEFSTRHHGSSNTQYNSLNGARSPQPVITKHIYFHVAPPDPEDIRPAPISNKKKTIYNILFIKLPSQQRKNQAYLQEMLRNQFSASAAKTLIYVLVKSPDDRPSSANTASAPNHEVFYVKYKDNRKIKNVVSPTNSAPVLQPG